MEAEAEVLYPSLINVPSDAVSAGYLYRWNLRMASKKNGKPGIETSFEWWWYLIDLVLSVNAIFDGDSPKSLSVLNIFFEFFNFNVWAL